MRVQIVNRDHPHFPEHGELTGKVIKPIWGGEMAEMKLDNCQHGTEACFISRCDIAQELVASRRRERKASR